jgi:hypothetical protein
VALQPRQITATHRNDPQWIIELWLAIHGGDPAPDARAVAKVSADIIKAVSKHLDPAHQKAVVAALGH